MSVRCREITCSSACTRSKGWLPFDWELNVYRGCEHGCRYCYAVYSHQYLSNPSDEAFFDEVYVKTNVVEKLEEQLKKRSWKGGVINLGSVTDSYQPIEERYKFMPEILRLLIKYRTPCVISTKSDLILRDYDLIAELARLTYVNVAATVTCMDERVRSMVEPHAVESGRRLTMLKEFSRTEASTGVHFMPIIPYITDRRSNVEALYAAAREAGVDYVLPGTLNLRGRTRAVFFDFIARELPRLEEPLRKLYKKGGLEAGYKARLYAMVGEIREKYGLSSGYTRHPGETRDGSGPIQMTLFPEEPELPGGENP